MKIERIEIYRVDMPLVYPFRTAFGNNETIESVLVRLVADGVPRWGGKRGLASLKGRVVRLRFQLVDAKLYSFQVQ